MTRIRRKDSAALYAEQQYLGAAALYDLRCLRSERNRMLPSWLRGIRHISICCLMVTMKVAIPLLVLSGASARFIGFMLKGTLLYLRTLCPLMMLLRWVIHSGKPFRAKHALLATVPTILCGEYSWVMNAKKIYSEPYFFFEVHRQL